MKSLCIKNLIARFRCSQLYRRTGEWSNSRVKYDKVSTDYLLCSEIVDPATSSCQAIMAFSEKLPKRGYNMPS